jgi:hypothetical protein
MVETSSCVKIEVMEHSGGYRIGTGTEGEPTKLKLDGEGYL